MFTRRQLLAGLAALPLAGTRMARAYDIMRFFRIGTGAPTGTYYPIGGLIAAAISNPPGSRACDQGGSCGVPGLIAVAQSTEGSVENARRLAEGHLEAALCQADVAYWAYHGEGPFAGEGAREGLRALAYLFPEVMHLVVRRDAAIREVKDLKGKRVSLDLAGSGTRADAELVLAAFGVKASQVELQDLSASDGVERLAAGELDALFLMAGAPAPSVTQLADAGLIDLVPLAGDPIATLQKDLPFFAVDAISPGTYLNLPQTPTISVGALWLVHASLPDEFVYQLVSALWNPQARLLLDAGHPRAAQIRFETATRNLFQPPLHPGALRYYAENGMQTDALPG